MMKFSVNEAMGTADIPRIEHAMKRVDVDAKVKVDLDANSVSVDSWLMPEEFFVAFDDEDFNVRIIEA
jgi:copper chaperone